MSVSGFDQTSHSVFLVAGDDDEAVARWKAEHPDWFVAGTWTGRRPASAPLGARPESEDSAGVPRGDWADDEGRFAVPPLLDPRTISLADFRKVGAAARFAPAPPEPDPNILPVQRMPPRSPRRGPGGGLERSFQEEILEERFRSALRRLREYEPQNRMMEFVRDPDRAPSESTVEEYEREAEAARRRAEGRSPYEPTPDEQLSLRRAMEQAGTIRPRDPRQSHHIVPQGGGGMTGDRKPAEAQMALREAQIDLDSAENGVALSEGFHRRLHTAAYYRYVNRVFGDAITPEMVRSRLELLRRTLEDADRLFQGQGVMPIWPEVRR